jgi:hypothetical protein
MKSQQPYALIHFLKFDLLEHICSFTSRGACFCHKSEQFCVIIEHFPRYIHIPALPDIHGAHDLLSLKQQSFVLIMHTYTTTYIFSTRELEERNATLTLQKYF